MSKNKRIFSLLCLLATSAANAAPSTQCYERNYVTQANSQGAPLGMIEFLEGIEQGSEIYYRKASVLDGSFFDLKMPSQTLPTFVEKARLVVTENPASSEQARTADAHFTLRFQHATQGVTEMSASYQCAYEGESFVCQDRFKTGAMFFLSPGAKGFDIRVDSKRGENDFSHLILYTWEALESVNLAVVDSSGKPDLSAIVDGEIDNIAVVAPDAYRLKKSECSEGETL